MPIGGSIPKIGVSNGGHTPIIQRRAMPEGWLAVVSRGRAGVVITVADDVPGPMIAAVERHVLEAHAAPGVDACHQPTCSMSEAWRGAIVASARASSA